MFSIIKKHKFTLFFENTNFSTIKISKQEDIWQNTYQIIIYSKSGSLIYTWEFLCQGHGRMCMIRQVKTVSDHQDIKTSSTPEQALTIVQIIHLSGIVHINRVRNRSPSVTIPAKRASLFVITAILLSVYGSSPPIFSNQTFLSCRK